MISVYVHFPWCLQKCPYCDFASKKTTRDAIDHRGYADAVLRELDARLPLGEATPLQSVFFGGGTPSLWAPTELGRVLRAIEARFARRADDYEVTAECNPSSLDADRAAAFVDAGVGRLSIGVQSLDDARLRYLGRLHDRTLALDAVRGALAATPRVSADLMFGMPGQTADMFLREVDELLATGIAHLSAYALTIEPGTQFGELHRKGRLPIAPEDDYAETFVRTHEALTARGYEHYEVSNYARAGEHSRHNAHYWRGGFYVGLGAGAVGMRRRDGALVRYRNAPEPATYIASLAIAEEEALAPIDLVREQWMLALRTSRGLDRREVVARVGLDPVVGRERIVERLVREGRLTLDGHRVVVPHAHWLQLDAIVAALF